MVFELLDKIINGELTKEELAEIKIELEKRISNNIK